MVKAAKDIPRPDGSVIKEGTVLNSALVAEFEMSSPQLLDCYVTLNSQYFKKVGKKLIPHREILEKDQVEVEGKQPVKVEEKPEKKVEDMTKLQLDKHADKLGIKLDRRKSLEAMLKEF